MGAPGMATRVPLNLPPYGLVSVVIVLFPDRFARLGEFTAQGAHLGRIGLAGAESVNGVVDRVQAQCEPEASGGLLERRLESRI